MLSPVGPGKQPGGPVARPVGPAQQPGSSSARCEAQSAARPVGPGCAPGGPVGSRRPGRMGQPGPRHSARMAQAPGPVTAGWAGAWPGRTGRPTGCPSPFFFFFFHFFFNIKMLPNSDSNETNFV